jgi:hypothetical protein
MVLKLRVNAPRNWEHAKCLGTVATSDYDPFFEDMGEALDYCNGTWDGRVCPIRHECLIFALTNNQREGVWGGTDEITRRAIRSRWPLSTREPREEWEWMTKEDAMSELTPHQISAILAPWPYEREDDE